MFVINCGFAVFCWRHDNQRQQWVRVAERFAGCGKPREPQTLRIALSCSSFVRGVFDDALSWHRAKYLFCFAVNSHSFWKVSNHLPHSLQHSMAVFPKAKCRLKFS